METYTLDEIREVQKDQKYKLIGLDTIDGKSVLAKNSGKTTAEDKIDQIEIRLKSPKLTDGYYIVHCRSHHSSVPDNYTIVKGDPEKLNEPAEAPDPAPVAKNDNVLSYNKAIAMNKDIAELKAEVEALKKENGEYATQISELEEENEDLANEQENSLSEENNMGQNLGTMIKESISALIPVLDRHYDVQEKKIELQQGQLVGKLAYEQRMHGVGPNGGPQGQPKGPSEQPQSHQTQAQLGFEELPEEELERMGEEEYNQYQMRLLVHLAETDPARYNELMKEIREGGSDE